VIFKQSGENMIIRGVGVRILTRDIPRLYDFYTEVLGFKVCWGERTDPFVSFKEADGDRPAFAIFDEASMQQYTGYVSLNGTVKTDQVVYCTGLDNLDEAYRELKVKGVEFLGEPQTIPGWGIRCVYFRDPEGNLFEIASGITDESS
jgi:catechol 2,3-dioxygenase-like lactoylglutathione lyase family enzyme